MQWVKPPAGSLQHIEGFDNFAPVRNTLRQLASEKDEWAGIPIPIDGERLVIEPSYRFAGLSNYGKDEDATPGEPGLRIRNEFWSHRHRCAILVYERQGKAHFEPVVGTGNAATMLLSTLGCSFAWGIEQESNAVKLLATLVRHHTFKHYLLTGTFLERSERSGVTYLFRRLRPTVALKENNNRIRILTTLCMHPIGYYAQSWAGAMCPTDDVIAHLMLMRGDEPMLWKRSSQHPPHLPAAGL